MNLPLLPERYLKLREEKNICRLVITNEEAWSLRKNNVRTASLPQFRTYFIDGNVAIIYADRVAVIDYASQTAFTVESAPFARLEERYSG